MTPILSVTDAPFTIPAHIRAQITFDVLADLYSKLDARGQSAIVEHLRAARCAAMKEEQDAS